MTKGNSIGLTFDEIEMICSYLMAFIEIDPMRFWNSNLPRLGIIKEWAKQRGEKRIIHIIEESEDE